MRKTTAKSAVNGMLAEIMIPHTEAGRRATEKRTKVVEKTSQEDVISKYFIGMSWGLINGGYVFFFIFEVFVVVVGFLLVVFFYSLVEE